MSFDNNDSLWDLSLPPSLPSLADDDFIALLQKQFGVNNDNAARQTRKLPDGNNVDPQVLTRFPAPDVSPPLSDDSPSPPSARDMSRSRRESGVYDDSPTADNQSNDEDHALKRKASNEDLDEEPNAKSQHTSGSSKKGNSSRRKSGGADESRLAKRKEQNRAAQRAFRERKEKHVKDLEDQVSALEEKNSAAVAENETLRDLISRLQNENMRLRESSFTFAMPSTSGNQIQNNQGSSSSMQRNAISNPFLTGPNSASPSSAPSSSGSPHSLFEKNDPSPLPFFSNHNNGMMDTSQSLQQQTATNDAMSMDFGFGLPNMMAPSNMMNTTPYKTLASNPLFTSYREPPNPYGNPMDSGYLNGVGSFDFGGQGMGHSVGAWPDIGSHANNSQMNLNMNMGNGGGAFDLTGGGGSSFDELFGGSYSGAPAPIDLSQFSTTQKTPPSTTSLSPISHHSGPPTGMTGRMSHSNSTSSSASASSPESQMSSTGLSPSLSNNNNNGNASANQNSVSGTDKARGDSCPKSKEDLAKAIAADSGSMFASPLPLGPDGSPSPLGPCEKGANFPKTVKSDANVEVFAAWRKITSNPRYKNYDVNELCTEFAEKARCDGSKVVLEPNSIQCILNKVEEKVMQQHQQQGQRGN